MRQSWLEPGDLTISKPRAILFCGIAGTRLTTGQQIEECVNIARAGGCPVAAPAPGDIVGDLLPPFDEQINIMVAQAILKALVNHPHAALWVDYSTRTPRLYCRQRSTLTPASLDISGRADISITPRHDQIPPCITICYEKSYALDNITGITTTIDHAPVVPGETTAETSARLNQVDALWAVYKLDGSSSSTLSEKVVVHALGYWMTSKAWWKDKIPWLKDYTDANITLSNPTQNGTMELDQILYEGTIHPWMNKNYERQTFWIEAKLTRTVAGEVTDSDIQTLGVELPMTDATSKTYKIQTSFDPGESTPEGLAAAMYAEWSQLHHDGLITLVDTEPSLAILPGHTLNLTGGMASWETMAAMIKRVSIDIDNGATTLEFGLPSWIDIDARVAWYRASHTRGAAISRIFRAEPEPEPDGSQGIAVIRDGASPNLNFRKRFVSPAAIKHVIDLNPEAMTGDTAEEMKPPHNPGY